MIALTVLYRTPDDSEKFDKYYMDTHVPLARALPGIANVQVTRFLPDENATAPEYHLMTQLSFADAEAMGAAMASDQGQTLAADVANLGTTPTILVGSTE